MSRSDTVPAAMFTTFARVFGRRSGKVGLDHVFDVGEVARLEAVAVDRGRSPRSTEVTNGDTAAYVDCGPAAGEHVEVAQGEVSSRRSVEDAQVILPISFCAA